MAATVRLATDSLSYRAGRKDFGRSLLRSTWHLGAGGVEATGTERRPVIAVLRRIWEFIPLTRPPATTGVP
jgi:hypothetical protein